MWENAPQYLLIFKLKTENSLIAETLLQAVLKNYLIYQLELLLILFNVRANPFILSYFLWNIWDIYSPYMGVLAHFFTLSSSLKLNKSTKTDGSKIDGVLVKGSKTV